MGRLPRPQKSFSRSKRKMQILNTFKIWAQHEDFEPKPISKVANALNMRPSPHLRDILREMAEAGELVESWRDEEGSLGAYVFTLPRDTYHEKFSRRHISLKKRGVVVGQLEMFS